MTFYPDMFISKWHLIAAGAALIAWFALLVGGYDRRTVLRSGAGAAIILYILATIPIVALTYQEHSADNGMRGELDRRYQERIQSTTAPIGNMKDLIVAAGLFRDNDSYVIRVYAGNYNSSAAYNGKLTLWLYDRQGREIDVKTYEHIQLAPGEKKQIARSFTSAPFEGYRYAFIPQAAAAKK